MMTEKVKIITIKEIKSKPKTRNVRNLTTNRKSPIKVIRPADITERLDDVAGCEQAKLEVIEVVSSLSEAKHYKDLKAEMPRCAMIRGYSGLGKNLLVRGVAAEAGVPLVMVSSSALIERQTDSRSRIEELFAIARSIGPCIVFIDEFEFIGRKREGNNSDQENSLDQLLSQLDELNATDKVVVFGATTKGKEDLDQALFAQGRFGQLITIPWPDIRRRAAMYKVHLRHLKISSQADKDRMAARLAILSKGGGRDVAEVCRSAARLAARDKSSYVEMKHLEESILRQEREVGQERHSLGVEERRRTAYHEAGHTLCLWFLEHSSTFIKVTIRPNGTTLGFTYSIRDCRLGTKEQFVAEMCAKLGGLVAEKVVYGSHDSGVCSDLKRLTALAYRQITQFGMSDVLGPIFVDNTQAQESQQCSAETKKLVDEEVRKLIRTALERTLQLIYQHKSDLEKIANKLLEKEVLYRKDLVELLGERPFADCFSFEELVESTRNSGPKPLPKGLEGWNRIDKTGRKSKKRKRIDGSFMCKIRITTSVQMRESDKETIKQDLIDNILKRANEKLNKWMTNNDNCDQKNSGLIECVLRFVSQVNGRDYCQEFESSADQFEEYLRTFLEAMDWTNILREENGFIKDDGIVVKMSIKEV